MKAPNYVLTQSALDSLSALADTISKQVVKLKADSKSISPADMDLVEAIGKNAKTINEQLKAIPLPETNRADDIKELSARVDKLEAAKPAVASPMPIKPAPAE